MASEVKHTLFAANHFSSVGRHLAIDMVNGRYRVVSQRVVDGAIVDVEPVDGRTFDSVYDARAYRAVIAKAEGK